MYYSIRFFAPEHFEELHRRLRHQFIYPGCFFPGLLQDGFFLSFFFFGSFQRLRLFAGDLFSLFLECGLTGCLLFGLLTGCPKTGRFSFVLLLFIPRGIECDIRILFFTLRCFQ